MKEPKPKITFRDLPEVFAKKQEKLSLPPAHEAKRLSFPAEKIPLIKDERQNFFETNNVQSEFLKECVKSNQYVYVFLMNGVKLRGIIPKFDNYSILLKDETSQQLIMKHAISTISAVNKS